MVLEDYLDISRRRQLTIVPLFKLQLHMLQDLVTAERMIGQYRQKAKEILGETPPDEEDAGADDAGEPESDSSTELETSEERESTRPTEEIRLINRELFHLKAEVRALRDIGDGIAWRLFDYDRAVLHELARRPSGKHINLDGILAELYALAAYCNERSGVPLLNDLTNFLKFGDLTIRRGSEFEIVEVKAGTSGGGRDTRQRQGLTEVMSLLSIDQGRKIDGKPVRISTVGVQPEMFKGNLRGLLDRAEADGAAVEQVGSHLVIECMDFMSALEKRFQKERVFAILDRGRPVLERWKAANDFVIKLDAHDRYAHAQNYAPLSIFPLNPRACVRLMSGAVGLRAFVNVSAVLRGLEERGWTVVKSPFQIAESEKEFTGELPMAILRKGRLTTSVPSALFGRLGMEFLKPKSLAQLFEAMLREGDKAGTYQFVNFAGEPGMWQ